MAVYRIILFAFFVGVLCAAGCDSGGNDLDEMPEPEMSEPEPEPEPQIIRLVGQLAIENENPNAIHSDVWGYVDPNTGKE